MLKKPPVTRVSKRHSTARFISAAIFDETDIQLALNLYEKFEIQNEICNVTVNSIRKDVSGLRSQCIALAEWNESIFGPPATPLPDGTHPVDQ